ncbi:ABC transporter ATP-binding protein [Candidatus Micrarchaeota archaeon]|nr:ABC transporter ATP-binding protein [Candidatus Micrarchaeota archaeon]
MKKEVLKLENVSKVYDMGEGIEVTALSGINLTVSEGDFACVLGPSGSGKSTLLHIMGILDRPTEGRVYIDGKDTTKMTPEEQARIRGLKIGFVFQAYNLVPSLRAWENVALPLVIQGVPAEDRKKKAVAILKELDMSDRLDHYPSQLSGGQRQRIAIGRALVNDPTIILADEPTGNLDSKTGKEVLEAFKALHDSGRTILVITHDEDITKIAHTIIRIKDGKITETKRFHTHKGD